MIIKKPKVCPPKIMLPPEVPYPIGKAACDPKSITVVKKGKMFNPINPADMNINQTNPV